MKPKKLSNPVSVKIKCSNFHAPYIYIYYNDGKLKSQYKCKVCSSTLKIKTEKQNIGAIIADMLFINGKMVIHNLLSINVKTENALTDEKENYP